MEKAKYLYRVEIPTGADVIEFNKAATRFPGKVHLVNGSKRLNAKSFLCVHLAKVAWSEIYIESDADCFKEFRRFIVK